MVNYQALKTPRCEFETRQVAGDYLKGCYQVLFNGKHWWYFDSELAAEVWIEDQIKALENQYKI